MSESLSTLHFIPNHPGALRVSVVGAGVIGLASTALAFLMRIGRR